jgi:N-glycosyltransferase
VRNARDLYPVAEEFRPGLVVRECTEFAGALVAERLGVPCVTLDIVPLTPSRHPGLLPELNRTRDALGLPPLPDTGALARDPWIGALPADWWPDELRTASHRFYRPPHAAPDGAAAPPDDTPEDAAAPSDDTPEDAAAPSDDAAAPPHGASDDAAAPPHGVLDQAAAPLDAAIAGLPGGRPFVLATLGSNTGHMLTGETSPLPRIVAALGELPCTAVVAIGAHADPASWPGPRPDNVLLVPFVPQRLLLAACDLFVTHAGFGGIREALAAGVPMVALPLYAEQPANASRLAELGLGVTVPAGSGPAPLAAACRRVLDDASFRYAARTFQRRILALPGPDQLVTDLTEIAAST